MSQNRSTDFPGSSQSSGQSSTNPAGTVETSGANERAAGASSAGNSSTATGTATALAQEYGGKISEAATHAKDYVSDKMTVVGDKIKELQNADFAEIAE